MELQGSPRRLVVAGSEPLVFFRVHGCGSKIGTQNGTLVSGNMDQNLWSPGGLILTHTHMDMLVHGFGSRTWGILEARVRIFFEAEEISVGVSSTASKMELGEGGDPWNFICGSMFPLTKSMELETSHPPSLKVRGMLGLVP